MEGTNEQLVGDVRTLWSSVPGPLVANLSFRVGQSDETLMNRGITHLCEHLLLSWFGSTPYQYQGTTGTTVTSFAVRGAPEEVAHHLSALCAGLRSGAFLDRLEHERRVLEIEGRQRGRNVTSDHLGRRFGAAGHGLVAWDEWGLHHLDRDAVWAWAATRFTSSNAVLALSGPPPEGLDMDLFEGVRQPAVSDHRLTAQYPSHTRWDGPAALSALVERSWASSTATSIYGERVVQSLRHDAGSSYSPAVDYVVLDGDRSLVVASTEAADHQGGRTAWQLYSLLGDLASNGPTAEELDRHRAAARRTEAELHAPWQLVSLQADELLHHGAYRTAEQIRQERDDLDVAKVHAAARELWHSSLVAVPSSSPDLGWNLPEHDPMGPRVPAQATRYPRREYFHVDNWSSAEALVCTDRLIGLEADGLSVIAALDPSSIALAHGDGTRTVIDRFGASVIVRPTAWTQGDGVIEWLDAHMGPGRTIAIGARGMGPTGSSPDALRGLRGMDLAARSGRRVRRSADDGNEALVGPMRLDQWAPQTDLPHSVPDVRRWLPSTIALGWLAHRRLVAVWIESCLPDTLAAFRAGSLGLLDLFAEVGGALYSDLAAPDAAPFVADLILPPADGRLAAMGELLGRAVGRPGEWWMATEQQAPAVWAEMDQRWSQLRPTWSPELGHRLSPPVVALKVRPSRCQPVS